MTADNVDVQIDTCIVFRIMGSKEGEDPELVRANPILPELQAALAAAVLRPLTPIYAQLSDLLYREVNTVITGEVAVAPAMETLQRNSIQLERSTGGIS